MDPSLSEAARTGDIDVLYTLIQKDPYILEGIDKIPFVDTPLHIAAIEGQINFAMEMMNLKPSFARKLNKDGFSPMHLALRNQQTKLVLQLLKTDKDLVRVKGRESMTPLLCAAKTGNSYPLVEFLEACPECIEDVTVQGETALHLALKSGQIEAFNLLIGWLQKNCHRNADVLEENIVNRKDNDDNTVLHIAARERQDQALKVLLDLNVWLDIRAKNSEGLTAREIAQNVQGQIMNRGEIAQNVQGQLMNSGENNTKVQHLKKKVNNFEKILIGLTRKKNSMSVEAINTMLVVTALFITATYQSSLSPPGGVWQGDQSSLFPTSNVTHHFLSAHNKSNSTFLFGEESRKAGTTIMDPKWYFFIWLSNSVTFWSAFLLTGFLLSRFSLFVVLLSPLCFLGFSFFLSMLILSPSATMSNINIVFIVILCGLVVLVMLFWPNRDRDSGGEIKGQQEDRTYFCKALSRGNNI